MSAIVVLFYGDYKRKRNKSRRDTKCKMEKIRSVISTAGKNLTEPERLEFPTSSRRVRFFSALEMTCCFRVLSIR